MERIGAADTRIVGLAERLLRPASGSVPDPQPEPAPDPAALLQAERERVLAEARAQGLAEGMRAAETEIQNRARAVETEIARRHAEETERLDAANARLDAMLRGLPEAVAAWETETVETACEVAYAAVAKLLGERAADPAWIAELCRQALAESRLRPVAVRVAHGHCAALTGLADGENIRIVGDADLAPGECRLETHRGLYDGGLEIRLEALKQALLRGLRSEPRP